MWTLTFKIRSKNWISIFLAGWSFSLFNRWHQKVFGKMLFNLLLSIFSRNSGQTSSSSSRYLWGQPHCSDLCLISAESKLLFRQGNLLLQELTKSNIIREVPREYNLSSIASNLFLGHVTLLFS